MTLATGLVLAALAVAEDATPPAAAGPEIATPGGDGEQAPAALDPAWQLYHSAFQALAHGDGAQARVHLNDLVRDHATHPAARLAQEILHALAVATPQSGPPREPALGEAEQPTGLARGELATFQFIHGVAVGGELCVLAECADARATVVALILGGGAGLGGSLLATRNGIRPGESALIISGTGWGFWNALALLSATAPDTISGKSITGTLLGGQLAGMALGVALYEPLGRPTAGDVTLATTSGTWASLLTLFVHGINEFDTDRETLWWSLLLSTDAGLVGGGVLATRYPMSRGRVLVINAGGLLGALLGLGADVIVQGDDIDGRPVFAAMLVGSVAGLAAGTYLSRDWDVPDAPVALQVLPTPGGAMASLRLDW
ncbi:MAG: hypothetical protein HYZ27_01135 [Deltaproteobacteria bacterium]|nr:hypothetical protein [Deltaproteobacteria bacterium]